ncbi:MAG: transglutaminase-like domain-containing protein [Bacteroidetes bacterium]|nr:transglutaminase-like domain-containing protein [Bacteroidota bacterium]
MNEKLKITSLLKLLDDPDDEIYTVVELKLLEYGYDALNELNHCENENELFKQRAEKIKSKIIHTETLKLFREFISSKEDPDLEEGVFILSKTVNPFLQTSIYKNVLNEYAKDLKSHISTDILTTDILEKISNYLFVKRNFTPNVENYQLLSNHLIDKVLETKMGIPLSLSFIYMFVAQRLNIPLKGIGLPGHFIVALDVYDETIYVDPFSYGKLITKKDCKNLVERSGFNFYDDILVPVSTKQMLERMIRNMISSYEKMENFIESQILLQYIDILHWKY